MILNDFHDDELGDDGREDYNDENWCEMEILNGLHPHYDDVANDAFSNLKCARMIDFTLAKILLFFEKILGHCSNDLTKPTNNTLLFNMIGFES